MKKETTKLKEEFSKININKITKEELVSLLEKVIKSIEELDKKL